MKARLHGVRRIRIISEYIKLDALLKFAAIASTGGEAKAIIHDGGVFVNGAPCYERGKKIRYGDTVRIGSHVLFISQ